MKLSETGENSHMRGREQTLLHFRGLGKKITSRFKKGQGIFNLGRGIFENTTSQIESLTPFMTYVNNKNLSNKSADNVIQ